MRLANAFPGQVLALEIGNETQISWSDYRVPTDLLIGYLRVSVNSITATDDKGNATYFDVIDFPVTLLSSGALATNTV